jgi:hypothetical protein
MTLTKQERQSDAEFLLHVEAQRRVLLPRETTASLPYVFVPRLSAAYVNKL